MSSYNLDPSTIDLDRIRNEIAGRELSPKRKILGEAIEARFSILKSHGIDSLDKLLSACKSKSAVSNTAERTGLPEEYLGILGREARGYLPQPIDLRRIPESDPAVIEGLRTAGLGDSKKLWERLRSTANSTSAAVELLAAELSIPEEALRELSEMADLARIPGVGPIFARIIHRAGYPTTSALAKADVDELDRHLRDVNAANHYTSVMANRTDLIGCIRWARELA